MRRLVLSLCLVWGAHTAIGAPAIDGTLDAEYGAALAVQTVQTGFGPSELDASYAVVSDGKLHLMITGNLEANFNNIEIFLDTKAGGQTVYAGPDNPQFNRLNGLQFDPNFAVDYHVYVRRGDNMGNATFDLHFIDLGASTISDHLDVLGGLEGSGVTGVGVNAHPIAVAFDNSNVLGVGDEAPLAPVPLNAGLSATTGLELAIDLEDLGFDGSPIRLLVGLNGTHHDYWSNQFLPGIDSLRGNLGGDGTGVYNGLGALDLRPELSSGGFATIAVDSRVVPEPQSIALALGALMAVAGFKRRYNV